MKTSLNKTHFAQAAATYDHSPKIATPAAPLLFSSVSLKWSLVYPEARTFAADEVRDAQRFIAAEIVDGRLALHEEVGFVIQHRCTGGDILYVCTWRDNNECWETIYSKGRAAGSRFQMSQRENTTGTFCVWVIPVLAHEQKAWVGFLNSARDAHAQQAYLIDTFSSGVG